MDFLYTLLVMLATIAVLVVAVTTLVFLERILLTQLAERDILFTFCHEGQIKYVMSGETLERMIIEVEGKKIERGLTVESWKIVDGIPERPRFWAIRKRFIPKGVYWVGIPPHRVFTYMFEWGKPIVEGEKLRVEHRKEIVDSLLFRYTYGITVDASEIKGFIRVTTSLTVLLEPENPYIPVMVLNGSWFITIVRPLIVSAVGNFVQGLSAEELLKKDKIDRQEAENLLPMIMGQGSEILKQTGMKLLAVNFSHLDMEKDEDIQTATRSFETARLKALGVVETAKGEALAIKTRGNAEAIAAKKLVAAAGERVATAKFISEGISAHKGPLSLGQGGLGIMVDERFAGDTPTPKT